MAKYVNRTNYIPLPVVRVFVVRDGYGLLFGLEPLLGHHLADAVVGRLHGMAVGVDHLLQAAVAVLVGVLDQLLGLAVNADAFEVMVRVVRQRILQAVAADDLGHVIERVVGVGYARDPGAVRLFARDLGCAALCVVLIGRLVAEAVGHFLVAGGIFVHGI